MGRLLVILGALLTPLSCLADATLIYHNSAGQTAIRTMVQGHLMRMDEGQKSSVIYDTASSTMTVIEHKERRYFRFDQNTINKLGSQVSAAQAELKAQLAQLPPEQRAMMENMTGGLKQSLESNLSQTEVSNPGKTETINGIKCRVMVYRVGGNTEYELCLADPEDVGVSQTDYLATRKAYAFASEFIRKIASNVGLESNIDYSKLNGLTVRVIQNGGDPLILNEVLDSVPTDAFSIPADYKEDTIEFE